MPATHDDSGDELASVVGLLGVSSGGTGADLSATSGILQQSSAGAAIAPTSAPTISSFASAVHTHANAAGGGQIAAASSISDYSTGIVTYSAALFTSDSGAWTVDDADELVTYLRLGRLLILWIEVATSDVAATPLALRYTLPLSLVAAERQSGRLVVQDASSTWAAGEWSIGAGEAFVSFYKAGFAATWTATSSDNTAVRGVILIRTS